MNAREDLRVRAQTDPHSRRNTASRSGGEHAGIREGVFHAGAGQPMVKPAEKIAKCGSSSAGAEGQRADHRAASARDAKGLLRSVLFVQRGTIVRAVLDDGAVALFDD